MKKGGAFVPEASALLENGLVLEMTNENGRGEPRCHEMRDDRCGLFFPAREKRPLCTEQGILNPCREC